jgi:Ca2+-transporting ATPase
LFQGGLFQNKWLNGAVLWEAASLVALVYVPFLQNPFHTFSFGFGDWLAVLLAAGTIVPVLEAAKVPVRRLAAKADAASI